MKTTIVTTTINIPHFLTGYKENAEKFGHNVDYIVIGDVKTPPAAAAFCETIPNCFYMGIREQLIYLRRFPALATHLPWNSVERTNIGMLYAYETGTDIAIMIQDDNFATEDDAIGGYSIVGQTVNLPTVESDSGWFNVCSILKEENDIKFYHRGYSPKHRWEKNITTTKHSTHKVIVNEGLWTGDPDTDAITRLERKLHVVGYRKNAYTSIALAPGTWSPFNCQNAAIAREAIPAYFMSPHIGRHSDIMASYVIVRLAEHFKDVISFGNPLAFHDRNQHNLWHDFDIEREGIQRTDEFCDALKAIKITGSSYHEGFGQIANELKGFDKITEGMKIWHSTFEDII